jgi:NADPH2:quinone reductase
MNSWNVPLIMEYSDKEVQVYEYGKLKVADFTLLSKPLAADELVVKVDSAPVNPSDFYHTKGGYALRLPPPYRIGFEGFGFIESVGSDENKALVGKPCLFTNFKGCFATRLLLNLSEVHLLDDQTNLENVRKNFIINPLSALYLIEIAKKHNAKAIIHTAASSNVGKWLSVLAKREGIHSTSIIRNSQHTEELKALGADVVIDSSAENYEEVLKANIKEHKPTVVFDALCGNKPVKILEQMPEKSMLVCYGVLEGTELTGIQFSSLFGRKVITSFMLGPDALFKQPHAVTNEALNKLYGLNILVDEQLQYIPLEKGDSLIEEWPTRKARLIIRP